MFTILFFFLLNANAQSDIAIGTIDMINSKILDEERQIWIHVPDSAEDGLFLTKDQSYPVVYLLDGDAHFYSVVGMIHQLSSVNGNTLCPKMIVVGIPNTNRNRDLTPRKGEYGHAFVDSMMIDQSGGGEKFMAFIEKELMPYIDSNYPTQAYRMLIGHSFGGLTAINTMIHHPHLFNSYIAIDPSMWWAKQQLLEEIKNLNLEEYKNEALYMGIANTLNGDMDLEDAKKDTTGMTEHIRSILELDELLKNQQYINYDSKYYPEDGHSSSVLITEYDALRFIFDFFTLNFVQEDFENYDSNILSKVKNHYKRLSKEFGEEMLPDEEFVNGLGYEFLGSEQFEKSEAFFKLNVSNYPKSFNVYDSLGDYYLATDNKEKAIENFKKSIAINADSYSKVKLKELIKE